MSCATVHLSRSGALPFLDQCVEAAAQLTKLLDHFGAALREQFAKHVSIGQQPGQATRGRRESAEAREPSAGAESLRALRIAVARRDAGGSHAAGRTLGAAAGPNDLMNPLLREVEDLSKVIERFALDAAAAPALPDPEDRAVALLARQRKAMLDVALDALEIERLLALPARWKMPDDDLDVRVAAV